MSSKEKGVKNVGMMTSKFTNSSKIYLVYKSVVIPALDMPEGQEFKVIISYIAN